MRRRAPLIAYRDNLEDEASAPIVDLQVSKLVCYQMRQMQVEAHPALKLPFVCRPHKVFDGDAGSRRTTLGKR